MDKIFKPIQMEDKKLFDDFFAAYRPEISELTFTNLWVWRSSRSIAFAVVDDTLLLVASYGGQVYFLPPIGQNVLSGYRFYLSGQAHSEANKIKLIPDAHIALLHDMLGGKFDETVKPDRDNFDYVYESDKLATLTSRKLSGKRNFIHRFENQYRYRLVPYEAGMREQCIALLHKWITGRTDDTGLRNEYVAILNLLDDYPNLNAVGAVLFVDDSIAAFAFGEPLNDSTFVIHFEKADTDFIGAYQMINRLFVRQNVLPTYRFVNREQDLGIDGIRRAKMSYYPDQLIAKHILYL